MEVEMEANRIVYIKYLEDLHRTMAYTTAAALNYDPVSVKPVAAAPELAEEKPGLALGIPKLTLPQATTTQPKDNRANTLKLTQKGAGALKFKKQPGSDFVIARHVVDFGHVVSGTIKTLRFKVTNPVTAGSGTLSWTFPKSFLGNSGFSISPEKVIRLPEGASADFEVVLNAKATIPLGQKEVELPLEGKCGFVLLAQGD